ncbi:MAG: dynamin family protein [Armatimonadota bacterium]|nr:dynamin family protein [Armatimonadota bacterium]
MPRPYQQTRDRLLHALHVVTEVAAARENHKLAQAAQQLTERLRQDQFNLVVLGQFKRGKTTFINALLGADLLPTAVVPLTSVVTILRCGEHQRVNVVLESGECREIALDDLPAYVTERGNPHNQKGVKEVEIFYPSEYLREGVRIVDTPGVGSVYQHNTRVAFEFIPRADAAIFLVTADLPISEAEARLLEDVRDYVRRIFFVQNKIDLVDEQEREESLQFSREVIAERAKLPHVTIHPLSARQALQAKRQGDAQLLERSLLPRFERTLSDFLMREKGALFLINVAENGLKVVSDLSLSIHLEQRAAEIPLADLDEKIALFQHKMEAIRRARNEDGLLIRYHINRLVADVLDSDLQEFQRLQRPALVASLHAVGQQHAREGVRALVDHINQHVSQSIEDAVNAWRAREEERLREALSDALNDFTDRTNQVIADVLRVAEEVFGVHGERFAPREELSSDGRFHFDAWKMRINPGLAAGTLFHILPRRWVLARLLRQAQHRMLDQFEVHTGRARYDFVQRIQKSTDSYIAALNEKIDATVAAIAETVRRAQEQRQAGEKNLAHRTEVGAHHQQALATAREELLAARAFLTEALSAGEKEQRKDGLREPVRPRVG